MNTRSTRKKDLFSKSDSTYLEQSPSKAGSTTVNDTEDEEDNNYEQFEKFPSPTFNIHIHVPYYDSRNSKFFLPRIQPIINLHFDELVGKLDNNTNLQNEKSFNKTFQNLLAKVSPKFGVVKFHFKNNSEERNIQECNINNVTPNTSRRHSNDMGSKKYINSEKSQHLATKTSKTKVINNNNNDYDNSGSKTSKLNSNNNCSNHTLTRDELHKEFKLKKAVVVLTDICKSKSYKHFFESSGSIKNQNNNESLCSFAHKLENSSSNNQKCETEMYSIKAENEFCTSGSFTTEWNTNGFDVSQNCLTDSDINLQTEKDINNMSHIKKICSEKNQNFTALVEGWSFSDILNRFQVKYGEKHGNCVASSSSIIESRNSTGEMDDDNNKFSHEFNEKIKKNKCTEEEEFEKKPDIDNKLQIEISKNEIGLSEKNCFDDSASDTTESFSFMQYQNETVNNFLINELDVLSEDSVHVIKKMKKENIESEFASDSNDSGSDESEIISKKEVSSKGIVDMEVVEHDLSSIRSNVIQENKFEVQETNKSSLSDVTHPRFHLELIKKEMQRRAFDSTTADNTQRHLKSENSDIESSPSGSTSSPKKMKLSSGKPETSEPKAMKSSQSTDFIRLNSSGPTEFSVTVLNKVIPINSEAKDFKNKMLFGKRVKRFSKSEQLHYQLKKDATRKLLNKISQ